MPQPAPGAMTLSELHPMHHRESQGNWPRHALRMHGSDLMALKRPYRSPESSRPYRPGDPLAMIDWRVYGRTNQLMVREQRDDASVRVLLFIEAHAPMDWPPADAQPSCRARKLEIACRAALHLACLHLRAGDRSELWLLRDGEGPALYGRWQPVSPLEILSAFDHLTRHHFSLTALTSLFTPHPHQPRRGDRSYWFGDTLTSTTPYEAYLALGQQKALFHILSSLEVDLSWTSDGASYGDQPLQATNEFLGRQLKSPSTFAAAFHQWQEQRRAKLTALGGRYALVTEESELSIYLKFVTTLNKR